jgi:hypothetical protein
MSAKPRTFEENNECDECSGCGVYFIDGKPQQCICLNMLDEANVQRAFNAIQFHAHNAAIDAACARMKEAYEANDGVMTLEEAAAEVAKLRTEPPR